MTHSALLILGGGLLTCVLAALVFGSGGSAEDKRLREERKLLRALEAQRRIRDAQLARADRRRRPVGKAQRPPQVEPPQGDDEQATARREQEAERPRAEQEREAVLEAENAQRRAAEQERKREEKEQEAARKAQRKSEEAARRRTAQERKAALKAAAAERRAAEQQRQRTEKEQAAARAQREAERAAAAEADRRRAVPMPTVPEVEEAKPLAELPLYSWAHRIENDDANPRTP